MVPLVIGSRVVASSSSSSRSARPFRPTIATICSRSGHARRRRSIARGSTSPRSGRAPKPKPCARARIRNSDGRQQIEVALRASEARYRTLAARTNRLHGLTAALSEAVTLKAVAQAVVRQGKIAVGATAGEVTLLVEHGTAFETLHSDVSGEHGRGRTPCSPPRSDCAPRRWSRRGSRSSSARSPSGRNATGARRRSPPTAATSRRRRCRCWPMARRSACSRFTSPRR